MRAAEISVLNLLERRFDMIDRVRFSTTNFGRGELKTTEYQGQKALDTLALRLRHPTDPEASIRKRFSGVINGISGLPNLMRFTYHIVAICDRQLQDPSIEEQKLKASSAYQNVRMLRAQLSDSELLIIALNCIYGFGYEKFKPLAERYALLHNMSRDDVLKFGLTDVFAARAFGVTEADREALNDAPPSEWFDAMEEGHSPN